MEQGKHYKKYKDLTEEQISWWTEQGVNLQLKPRTIIRNILTKFNIDINELIHSFELINKNDKDNDSDKSIEIPKNIEKQTLKSFCIQNGYNYDVVSKALKLHKMLPNDSLEQLLNRVINKKKNKKGVAPWIYDVYGFFIEEILLELNLDASMILNTMYQDIIPIEKAICYQIFSRVGKNKNYKWVKGFYQKVIEKIDFHKTEEENA